MRELVPEGNLDLSTPLTKVREYWEGYAERAFARAGDSNPRAHFERLREDHETAYARPNELLRLGDLRGKALLELGCGMGFDTIPFAQAGARVLALDLSEKCIELTRRHLSWYGVDAELRVGDAECLDLPSDSFDIVTARGLLMFTPDPAAVIREAYRVLRPGGRFQAILHNRYSWYVGLARVAGMNLIDPAGDPDPNRLYTRREARELFEEFADVRIEGARTPTMRSKRGGITSALFNVLIVPAFRLVPQPLMSRLGYYLVIEGTKPLDPGEGR